MLYINDTSTDPYWNLAAEEYLLKNFKEPVFRLWRNSNSIIVGQYQNTLAEIDYNYVKENDIKVVRRLSGGGAVFHDLGNLNFTFIEQKQGMEESNAMFRRFTAPIIKALNSLGVDAYIEGRNDLLIDGKKFSGNAICIYKDRILQHGTLLFSANMSNLSQALKSRPEKFIGKAVQSTRSRVTNISSHLTEPMELDKFQQYLGEYICNSYSNFKEYHYTPEDLAAIEELKANKYLHDSWNFGHSPAYQLNNTGKFSGGLVELSISAKNGRITAMEIYGDYFFTLPTEEFIALMTGTEHTREAIGQKLEELPISQYFNGITNQELLSLFF